MRQILKKIGRFFIALNQEDNFAMRQSVLIVEGSFILPNNFTLIVKDVKQKFANADIVILCFDEKKELLKARFPEAKIFTPLNKFKGTKYRLAFQLFLLLRRKFGFIVLSSLDISLLTVVLIFSRCPLFLHNRWLEWYGIRQRTLADVFKGIKSADRNRRRQAQGIKGFLKNLGRVFVILTEPDAQEIKSGVLIEDNGYTDVNYILTAVRQVEMNFINPDTAILTFASRQAYFRNNFPEARIVIAQKNSRYGLAQEMFHLRNSKFSYVVLTSLDISVVFVSMLFMKTKVLLYNRWHQWWSLSFRNIFGYFKEILNFLITLPILLYLFIRAAFILTGTAIRLTLIKLKRSNDDLDYEN